jgi:Do/DeqQ family serine protease
MNDRMRSILKFLAQAAALGLATALILSWLWPRIFPGPQTVEIIREETPGAVRPSEGPVSYATAVEMAAPAVVNVHTAKVIREQRSPFFDDFRRFFGNELQPRERVQTSLGSGVIISDKGYILTNNHVIRGADAIQVGLRDGRTAAAEVVGTDPDTDLAVLKIKLKKLPVITVGNSTRLQVGDVVLAIGNPFGVGQTVTMGIVSATGRSRVGISMFENFIQTDAAINPGNSGGALVDARGRLIGINTAIFSKTGTSLGIGFAIPMSMAQAVFEDIVEHGRPLRGWLGISAQAVTPEIADALDLPKTAGVVVVGVLRDGPADRSGLKPGDVILAIDGQRITEPRDALMSIASRRPGAKIQLTVLREGKEHTLGVTAIERPQQMGRTQ